MAVLGPWTPLVLTLTMPSFIPLVHSEIPEAHHAPDLALARALLWRSDKQAECTCLHSFWARGVLHAARMLIVEDVNTVTDGIEFERDGLECCTHEYLQEHIKVHGKPTQKGCVR